MVMRRMPTAPFAALAGLFARCMVDAASAHGSFCMPIENILDNPGAIFLRDGHHACATDAVDRPGCVCSRDADAIYLACRTSDARRADIEIREVASGRRHHLRATTAEFWWSSDGDPPGKGKRKLALQGIVLAIRMRL